MKTPPKAMRGPARRVERDGETTVEADFTSPGGTVHTEHLTTTPRKSLVDQVGGFVNDVWHRMTGFGSTAATRDANRLLNSTRNRNARKRRKRNPGAAERMEAAALDAALETAEEQREEQRRADRERKHLERENKPYKVGTVRPTATCHGLDEACPPAAPPPPRYYPTRQPPPQHPPPPREQQRGSRIVRMLLDSSGRRDVDDSFMRMILQAGFPDRDGNTQGTENCAFVQFQLGQAYENRWWGMQRDMEAAKQCYERALNSCYSQAGFYLGELLLMHHHDLPGAVEAYRRASSSCDCWTEGRCSHDAVHPHDPNNHTPSWEASLELARGFEYGDLGAYSQLVHLPFSSTTQLSRLTTPPSTHP
jgi:hypothetical protein